MTSDRIARLVAQSREAQGLPATVTDPEILRRVVALLEVRR